VEAIEDIDNADAPATPIAMAAAKRSAPVAGKKKRKKA